MNTYYGTFGNNHVIMCRDFNEIYTFDMFGSLISRVGSVSSCSRWQEVDVLSFVSRGTSECEILFDGFKTVLNMPIFNAINPIRSKYKYIGTVFSITHEDDLGKFTQVLFVFPKGYITKGILLSNFPNTSWKSI